MHLIGKSLVIRTRAATEGRPYTGAGVGAGLRARPISPNNRLFRQPPEGRPYPVCDCRGGPPWPPEFASPPTFATARLGRRAEQGP